METDEDHAAMREIFELVQNFPIIEYTWRISCSFVGKYDWKTVESYAIWFGLFDNIIWRELLVSLYLPPNFCGTAFPGQESPLDIAIFLWSGNNLGFKILENPNDYFSRKLPWYSSGAAIQIQLFSSSTLFTFFNLYVLLEKIRNGHIHLLLFLLCILNIL